jgi:hypothetical protein
VTCNDTAWDGGRDGLIEASEHAGRAYPLIGWLTIEEPCAFWNRPGSVDVWPPSGEGLPPILIVQSEHDPATPVEGARRTAERLASSRFLLVTGEGDHGLYGGRNRCVNSAVERFLVKGVLPDEGATCQGLPLPSPADGYGPAARPRSGAAQGSGAARGSGAAQGSGVTTGRGPTTSRAGNPLVELRRLDSLLPGR